MATTNPELVEEWDFEKNGEKTPYNVSKGHETKVWWKCKKGHEWEVSVNQRTNRNSKCPYCSGNNIIIGETDLASTHPDLIHEWDYSQNGTTTPLEVKAGSNKSVWWKCKKGHQYQLIIYDRAIKGQGCPYCSNHRLLIGFNDFETRYPELVIEWDYEHNKILPNSIIGSSSKKVWWKCARGHQWQASINNRVRGNSCPYCSGNKVLTGYNDLATINPALAMEWHPIKNGCITPDAVSKGCNCAVWWLGKCGHEWKMPVNARTNGSKCPYCASKRVLKGFNDLATAYPEIAMEWHPTKNGNLKPTEIMKSSNKKIWWLGRCGHEWSCSVNSRTTTGGGCPYCSNHRLMIGFNDFGTLYPDLAKEWDYERNKLKPSEIIGGCNKKVWWKCENGHSWYVLVSQRAKVKSGCPYCIGSKTERLVRKILSNANITYESEKKFLDKPQIKKYPYDIWIPEYQVIIELDGEQHFTGNISFFEKKASFKTRVTRDNIKNEGCLRNHWSILRIPYTYDPEKNEKDITSLVLEFVKTKVVPNEILDFYRCHEFSNYSNVANLLNRWIKSSTK